AAPSQTGQPYKVTLPNGASLDFTIDASAGLIPTPGNDSGFQKNADNSLDMTAPDNRAYHFNAQGQITAITSKMQRDPGRAVSVVHGADGLAQVVGTSGRSVTYAWANGKIASITDSQGRHVNYGYDGNGRLATVTDLDGKAYTYSYDSTTGKLTAVTSPMGRAELLVGYDVAGRVAWFEEPGKGRTTVEYHPLQKYALFTRADGGV